MHENVHVCIFTLSNTGGTKKYLLSKCDTEKLDRQQTHKNLCGTTMVIPQNVNTQFTKINSCFIKQLFHGLDIMTS